MGNLPKKAIGWIPSVKNRINLMATGPLTDSIIFLGTLFSSFSLFAFCEDFQTL